MLAEESVEATLMHQTEPYTTQLSYQEQVSYLAFLQSMHVFSKRYNREVGTVFARGGLGRR